jgi:hypothetical protein
MSLQSVGFSCENHCRLGGNGGQGDGTYIEHHIDLQERQRDQGPYTVMNVTDISLLKAMMQSVQDMIILPEESQKSQLARSGNGSYGVDSIRREAGNSLWTFIEASSLYAQAWPYPKLHAQVINCG